MVIIPESRWAAPIAVAVVLVAIFTLPDRLEVIPAAWRALFGTVIMVLLIGWALPARGTPEPLWHFLMGRAAMILMLALALFALGKLLGAMLYHSKEVNGLELLYSGLALWLSNTVMFGIWYWLLDRGGPERPGQPELQFPQMQAAAGDGWRPTFFDYIFVGFTTSTAFSPTDTLPLSHRMKALMLVQALISLVTVAMIAARAVNILS